MSNNYEGTLKDSRCLNVGHGNGVMASRVIAILGADSLPVKRLRERASGENLLIDATAGRRTKALVITDSKHIILSALSPQTLQERLVEKRDSTSRLEFTHGQFAS